MNYKRFSSKLNNIKGFTLAELLIVVAITAVLVAIAIPVFSSKLEKSRESVDIANMRNAYALISVSVITEDNIDGKNIKDFSASSPAYYDVSGRLTAAKPSGYGKGTAKDAKTVYSACTDYGYDPSVDYRNGVITVWYDGNIVHVHWDNGAGTGGSGGSGSSGTGGSGSGTGAADTIKNAASEYPDYPGESPLIYNTKTGNVYTKNGIIYIAADNVSMTNKYDYKSPETLVNENRFITPNGKVLTSSDVNEQGQLKGLKKGDVFDDGSNLYIRRSDSDFGTDPKNDSWNWIKINIG